MDRLIRLSALAVSGATLIWLAGCGGPAAPTPQAAAPQEPSPLVAEMQRRAAEAEAAEQAAAEAAAAATRERLLNEPAAVVTTNDMRLGKRLTGRGPLQTPLRAGIAATQRLNLLQVRHALNLFWGLEGRYPESHEEFVEKVINANHITLEPLDGPYEYWYNAEDHQLYKRPIVQGDAERAAEPDGPTLTESARTTNLAE